MTPLVLHVHPAETFPAPLSARVVFFRAGEHWQLCYQIVTTAALVLPPPAAAPEFRDNLWQHTCCEAFFARADGSYREYNLSPSGHWAAYDFRATRTGQTPRTDIPAPAIVCAPRADGFRLTTRLPVDAQATRFALSLVLETQEGQCFHLALAHPAEKPDFHHPEAFRALPDEEAHT